MTELLTTDLTLGARYTPESCTFRVWAPLAQKVELHLTDADRYLDLQPEQHGYFALTLKDVAPDTRYTFRLDGAVERPDPASRFQPDGVHAPSAVVDPAFAWNDAGWQGLPLDQYVFYELHVGTFTPEGSFDAIIPRLPYLKELGITAVELLPLAQNPGSRNWGYDGVYPYAVQASYGGPAGLRRLVDACHALGLAVVLDVVYNHLGPEGNYLRDFGPYFTPTYHNLWGDALNFDAAYSDGVRRFFVENALYWMTEFHIDAFRCDALDTIIDMSARHVIADLTAAIHALAERQGRRVYAFGELGNTSRYIRPYEQGGYGLDGQWADEFHHALHTLLTGEQAGYYAGFGQLEHMARAWRDGYTYTGQYSPHRKRRYGDPTTGLPGTSFVVCTQNHDQVGNRLRSDRLAALVPFEALKLAAGLLLFSPYLPLLFMGEEYGEPAPFYYFVDHSDPGLIAAVREGRQQEYAAFLGHGELPDPQAVETFERSIINLELHREGSHAQLFDLYRTLIGLRKQHPLLGPRGTTPDEVVGFEQQRVLFARRERDGQQAAFSFNFSPAEMHVTLPLPAGRWTKIVASNDPQWCGVDAADPGVLPDQIDSAGEARIELPAWAFVVYSL